MVRGLEHAVRDRADQRGVAGERGAATQGGRRSTGYVDYVITPTVGTGWLIGEDAIDRYLLKGWIEKKAAGRLSPKVKILRSVLTPTTAVGNMLR